MRNIRDYGAVGDGIALDTAPIQRAIDDGGIVYIPAGTYRIGTLYLKSNGGLHLDPGAVLTASHNREDYNADDFCPQNEVFTSEHVSGTHLIIAAEQENISITGFGTIDGQSHHWVNETATKDYCEFYDYNANPDDPRPGQMIYLAECKNVRIQDVHLLHAAYWNLFLHGCEDAQIRGLRVTGEKKMWMNDGIDLDCCSRVTVSDCIIDTGDDGITLRANGRTLVHKDAVCEHVTITNCVLTSYLGYGMRIGVGDGVIRNCTISNLVIKNSLTAIGMMCRFSPDGNCVSLEQLHFQNLFLEGHRSFELRVSNNDTHPALPKQAHIRDISFSNVHALCHRPSYLLGFDNGPVSDITFRDLDMVFTPEDPTNHRYPTCWGDVGDADAAFFVRQAENVTFQNLNIRRKGELPQLKYDLKTERTPGLETLNLKCNITTKDIP